MKAVLYTAATAIALLVITHLRADTALLTAESTPLGNDYYESPWLGTFYADGSGWLYNEELGWLYCASASSTSALWFYSLELGWIFTGNGTYASLYVDGSRAWVYFFESDGTRYFYNFDGDYYAPVASPDSVPGTLATATLNGAFHDVGGQVSLLDNGVIVIENFTFDGGGINVRAILSTSLNYDNYTVLSGNLLRDTAYDGTIMRFLVPDTFANAQTLYLSIWCVPVSVSFGSATFSR